MNDDDVNPTLDWYLAKSRSIGLSPRCPFAAVERCPRYFDSLSLLGRVGSTAISTDEDDRLERFWQGSDLLPRTREYAAAIHGETDEEGNFIRPAFDNFCPEVLFERFGYFASALHRYPDELDHELAVEDLARRNLPRGHWRWRWAHLHPMHYTECPLYSPLAARGAFVERPGPEFKLSVPGASVQFKFSWDELRRFLSRQWAKLKELVWR